jgi:hypothetical protein
MYVTKHKFLKCPIGRKVTKIDKSKGMALIEAPLSNGVENPRIISSIS